MPFVPLLLGADINVYSMARAFHEAYGVKTVAYGKYLGPLLRKRHHRLPGERQQ